MTPKRPKRKVRRVIVNGFAAMSQIDGALRDFDWSPSAKYELAKCWNGVCDIVAAQLIAIEPKKQGRKKT